MVSTPHRLSATLVAKQNHSNQCVVLIDFPVNEATRNHILKTAKNKLRMYRPSHIFLPNGSELANGSSSSSNLRLIITSGEPLVAALATSTDTGRAPINIIASQSEVSPQSHTQLKACAGLPGMVRCIGMPDLHPGGKTPIGAVFQSRGWVYPDLIGGDIGCGMTVFKTGWTELQIEGKRGERLATLLTKEKMENGLIGASGVREELKARLINEGQMDEVAVWDNELGSIGGGNHFAELQVISSVSPDNRSTLVVGEVVLVVHSGFRRFGQHILGRYPKPLPFPLPEASAYLTLQDLGIAWARVNRLAIAYLFFSAVEAQPLPIPLLFERLLVNICHNFVRLEDASTGLPSTDITQSVLAHRKGAASGSGIPLSIIPGSRGTLTAFFHPTPTAEAGFSLAHGAGRAAPRKVTAQKMASKFSAKELEKTDLGGIVICEDKSLIYEEAPEGYKDVGAVIADLEEAGQGVVWAWGIPRISYKVRR